MPILSKKKIQQTKRSHLMNRAHAQTVLQQMVRNPGFQELTIPEQRITLTEFFEQYIPLVEVEMEFLVTQGEVVLEHGKWKGSPKAVEAMTLLVQDLERSKARLEGMPNFRADDETRQSKLIPFPVAV